MTLSLVWTKCIGSLVMMIALLSILFIIPLDFPSGIMLFAAVVLLAVLSIKKVLVSSFRTLQERQKYATFVAFFDLSVFVSQIITAYAVVYKAFGLLDGDQAVRQPLDFLYFSIVTWTTLGYGDFRPTPSSRMVAASEALFGYFFMGLYLSIIFHVISRQSTQGPSYPPTQPQSPRLESVPPIGVGDPTRQNCQAGSGVGSGFIQVSG